MSRRSIKTTAPGEGASPATATASATAQKIPAWLGVGLCLLSYQRNIEFRSKRLRATSCRCGGTKTRSACARHFGAKRAGSPHSSSHDPHYHSELVDTIRGSSRISSCLERTLAIEQSCLSLCTSAQVGEHCNCR